MIYRVQARYIEEKVGEFYKKLTDGTIANQEPDGKEIVSSMQRAKITGDNQISWYETCYCETPLKHERETVYDQYLVDIHTRQVEDYGKLEGHSFWSYLQSLH